MKSIKTITAAAMLLAASPLVATAQVGINTVAPDSSALLDIRYSGAGKAVGVLLPDLNSADRSGKREVVSHGVLVFDRAERQLYYYDSLLRDWTTVSSIVSVHKNNGFADIRPQNAAVNAQNMSLGLPPNEAATAKLDVNGSTRVRQNLKVDGNGEVARSLTVADTLTANTLVGYGAIPVGGIIMWSGTNVPDGWALCNGQTLDGYKTPDLRGRFIAGYGADGSGLPANVWDNSYSTPGNLSRKGTTSGSTGGERTHTLSTAELPAHKHDKGTLSTNVTGEHSHLFKGYHKVDASNNFNVKSHDRLSDDPASYGGEPAGNHSHIISGDTGDTGGGTAHENRPPYYVLAFIMRVK
jgi:microcystin-dependent protein